MIVGSEGVLLDTDFKTKWWWFTNYWFAYAHALKQKGTE